MPPAPQRGVPRLYLIGLAAGCVLLVWLMKLPGLLLAGMLLTVVFVATRRDPGAAGREAAALTNSVRLSAEDIRDVLEAFEKFRTSQDADALADRTFNRPALADPDTSDPEIQRFHYQCHGARRFLNRLEARLADPDMTVRDLERLLAVTDRRAVELEESWLTARRAARRTGRRGRGLDRD